MTAQPHPPASFGTFFLPGPTEVRPERREIEALAEAYEDGAAAGAADAVRALRESGVRVVVVSGGVREAIVPFAAALGVRGADVHAVSLRFADDGAYAGFDEQSPLTTATGKRSVVEALALPSPALGVGDGSTDLAMRPAVAAFAAYAGFVRREVVVAGADYLLPSFTSLRELVLA